MPFIIFEAFSRLQLFQRSSVSFVHTIDAQRPVLQEDEKSFERLIVNDLLN
jgi:hypothetical protein